MKNLTLIIAFLFIGINIAAAQETAKTAVSKTLPEGYITVTGVVTDNMGLPLPSAMVQIKGVKGLQVQTDFEGEFTIVAKEGDKLEFTYLGMKSQVITVSKKHTYEIKLQDDIIDTGLVIYARNSGRLRGVAATYMFNYD